MRIILATIAFVMLATPSWAMDNEDLLDSCKVYANNNFTLSGLSDLKLLKASSCLGYMVSALEQSIIICSMAKEIAQSSFESDIEEYMLIGGSVAFASIGTSATHENINAIIQTYINYANDNPKEWEYYPSKQDWLTNNWPCEME